MRQWALPILIAVLACACAERPVRIESSALGNPSSQSADRYVIAAVDNVPAAFTARSGSTLRGYDAIAQYGPTSSVIKTMRSLETDYGLREVSAWPIKPLHMYCAVLELPVGSDRPHGSRLVQLNAQRG